MKQVWKWIMHLDARAFCIIALLFFFLTAGWSSYLYMTPPQPFEEGSGAAKAPGPWLIGTLDFVNRQLDGEDFVIPVAPFRPTMEAILRSPEVTQALLNAQNNRNQPGGRQDPFANLRQNNPNAPGAPGAAKMITPKISFLGFFKRSDGTLTAMFSDSSNNSTFFYAPGKTVHGIEILGADMKEASIRLPDGSETKIPIGKSVELAPEPEAAPQGA